MKRIILLLLCVAGLWAAVSSASIAFITSKQPAAAAGADFTNNLVLWLNFQGTNTTGEIDRSTNNVTMTWSSGVTYFQGPNASSIAADPSSGQYLFTGTSAVTDTVTTNRNYCFTNQDFSVSAWFKLKPTANTYRCFFWQGGYQVSGFTAYFYEPTTNMFLRSNQVGANQDAYSIPFAYPTNNTTWFQIVVVRSGANATFYYNGNLLSTTNGLLDAKTSSRPMKIGIDTADNGTGAGLPLTGMMADFRVFNKALIQADVTGLWGSGPPSAK